MSLGAISKRRRLEGLAGRALLGCAALLSVAALAYLLWVISSRGFGAVLAVSPSGWPAAALGRIQAAAPVFLVQAALLAGVALVLALPLALHLRVRPGRARLAERAQALAPAFAILAGLLAAEWLLGRAGLYAGLHAWGMWSDPTGLPSGAVRVAWLVALVGGAATLVAAHPEAAIRGMARSPAGIAATLAALALVFLPHVPHVLATTALWAMLALAAALLASRIAVAWLARAQPAPARLRPLAAAAAWLVATLVAAHVVDAILDATFLYSFSSRTPEKAGIVAGIFGTFAVGLASMAVALPVGIMAAVYLNEFARPGRMTSLIRASIANLAGVPSIVFGMLGLAMFVRVMGLEYTLAAAGLTLGLLTLPVVIVVAEEALKSVPNAVREAALGLGASRWQAVRHHVLPYSLPGMLTGSILALSRTMGETAPLIMVGAAAYIAFLPTSLTGDEGRYTALPIMVYNWATEPKEAFQALAWGGVLVLVALVLVGNMAAILLRDRFQRKYRW